MIVHGFTLLILAAGVQPGIPAERSMRGQAASSPAVAIECKGGAHDCAARRIEQGDFNGAIAFLQAVLARAPGDLKALNLLGIALTGAGRTQEANGRFRAALKLDPEFLPARKNLAINEFNQGRLTSAERLFNDVIVRLPSDEVAHLHLGEIHHKRKQPALAVSHYEKSGARVSSNPVWTLHYADSLLEQGQTARASKVLEALPAADGGSHFEAGMALGRREVYADAARHFGTARATYKDPYAAGYNQTLMLVKGGDFEGAIAVAADLFGADFKRAELYNLVARAYVAKNRIQDAYDALRTATRLEPSEEQHYLDLALICLDHENFDLGVEIVDVGLQYRATPRLHLYRGVLLVMKGLVDQAELEFQKARTLGPGGSVPDVALAMAWMQSGNTSKAVELLRDRMSAGSSHAVLPYIFGIALMRSGIDPTDAAATEAIGAFESAIRLDPELAGPRTELGKILLRRGETLRAIEELERAAALDRENPAPSYLLAQAYRRTGNTDRAQELLAHVSKLNAQGRGDDPDKELKRIVVRIVREGVTAPAAR